MLPSTTVLVPVVGVLTATGVAVTATYAVPLALVVAELLVLGVATAALAAPAALRHQRRTAGVGGGFALVVVLGAVLVATPSAGLQALALGVLLGIAVATVGLLRTGVGTAALALVAPTSALLVVDLGRLLSSPVEPVLALAVGVVGLLLVAVARPANEVAAALTAAVLTAGVAVGEDPQTWLAVHLTLAGTAAAAAALVHATRRPLAWVGGVLLVLASWVRLADEGVTVPEAYTLPAALVLLAVGVVALLRDPRRRSTTTLVSGLVLALAPSTLLALDDPATLRGLLLTAASLALVLGGATLRWSAPLVAGSVVGALLLLRALAPYAAELPPYLVMIAAGAVLVTVGVTWESRLASLRRGRRYVARLR
ncbi:SCO7613 C-terminal domain-containing membrane protein [Nocardioides zeae]